MYYFLIIIVVFWYVLVIILYSFQYKNFVVAIERLLNHPCAYKLAEFISEYQKPMISTKSIVESSPVIITL